MKLGAIGNAHREHLRLEKVAQLPPIKRIAALAPRRNMNITIQGRELG
jgi:hypothetical protein